MKKINQIIQHPLFQMSMDQIENLEKDRCFCCHGMDHSLDVARIAYITVLERQLQFSRECLYAAALLHDIGRWQQYTEGISHHEASAELAAQILEDTDFNEEEKKEILEGVRCHRMRDGRDKDSFQAILYMADKQSRNCWLCKARKDCYWPEEQKNRTIIC